MRNESLGFDFATLFVGQLIAGIEREGRYSLAISELSQRIVVANHERAANVVREIRSNSV
jgi:hypothetical protein